MRYVRPKLMALNKACESPGQCSVTAHVIRSTKQQKMQASALFASAGSRFTESTVMQASHAQFGHNFPNYAFFPVLLRFATGHKLTFSSLLQGLAPCPCPCPTFCAALSLNGDPRRRRKVAAADHRARAPAGGAPTSNGQPIKHVQRVQCATWTRLYALVARFENADPGLSAFHSTPGTSGASFFFWGAILHKV